MKVRSIPLTFCTRTGLALTACAIVPACGAQTMYRCGNAFSQVPCDKVTATAPIMVPRTSPAPALPKGRDLCKAAVPRLLPLKDPYSAVIESISNSGRPIAIRYANEPMMAFQYIVTINAKNSFGAYTGAKPYFCYVNEAQSNVLAVTETPL